MPNVDAIKAWVEDLRSGRFKQGTGQLRRGDKFCCLGVACETFRRVTGEGEWDGYGCFVVGDVRDGYALPGPVSDWFGFEEDDENPALEFPGCPLFCTEANDEHRKRFTSIASAVERTFLTSST